jgi:CRISPR/Cas system-associated exonuclease Cas4 (RecB family)
VQREGIAMNSNTVTKHISPSQIKTYLSCGRKYKYKYVEGLVPEKVSFALPFGRAFHQTIADINLYRKQHTNMNHEDAYKLFKETFERELTTSETPVTFEDGEDTETLVSYADGMLKLYTEHIQSLKTNVIAVEHELEYPIEGTDYLFTGIVDTIESDNTGICIVELKTTGRMWSDSTVDYDIQGPLYKKALTPAYPQEPIHVRYDIVTRGKNPKVQSKYPDCDNHIRLTDLLREVINGIEKNVFIPKPGYECNRCDYKAICMEVTT